MDLDDVEAFLTVVERNGFRRAAEALFVSQPTVSRRVQRLEQELHAQLLRRTADGVELTPRGAALMPRARRLLTIAEESRATTTSNRSDTIVLACTSTGVVSYLTGFLPNWILRHPGTRIRVIEDSPRRNRQYLSDQECDVAILAGSLDRTLTGLPIGRVVVEAIVPVDHPLGANEGPLDVRALDDQPVLVTSDEYLVAQMLRTACRAAAVHPEIIFQSTIGHALASLARAGLGIAVLSNAVTLDDTGLIKRALTGPDGNLLAYDVVIAWDRDRLLSPVLDEFVHDLSEFTRPTREAGTSDRRRPAGAVGGPRSAGSPGS